MRVIAFYLPQFHEIPENNDWWGKGFTEWVNVRKAKPLFVNHDQPRVPLSDNYYNLLDVNTQVWQAELAKKYGVYGFCYYHYWFSGKLLLEKPMENMLSNSEIDLPFCICWANEPWTKAWVGEKKVLIPQAYGKRKEWEEHFYYLLPFFKDKRYICEDGKPLVVIYRPEVIECLNEMLDCWTELAKENGLSGIVYAYQNIDFDLQKNKDDSRFTYNIEFQPLYARHDMFKSKYKHLKNVRRKVAAWVEKRFGIDIMRYGAGVFNDLRVDYDKAWNKILTRMPENEKNVPGAFVGWDNSPRKGKKGEVYVNDTPEKFRIYLTQQIKRAKDVYHKDLLFMYAWNEWAEGGYLEPDTRTGYRNLEAIYYALKDNGELPENR